MVYGGLLTVTEISYSDPYLTDSPDFPSLYCPAVSEQFILTIISTRPDPPITKMAKSPCPRVEMGSKKFFRALLMLTDNLIFVSFFCFLTFRFFAFQGHFQAIGTLLGYFWGWGGAREVFLGLLIRTDNFYFVRFFVF